MLIGMYAHHHGSGHLFRCGAIAAELRSRGHQVCVFSSRAGADVRVPLDVDEGKGKGRYPEFDAHGALHWAPLRHQGLRERMAAFASFTAQRQPAAWYVDVSVEVLALVRLMGVPVVTLAMPGLDGERRDAPHTLGYRLASRTLAAWPDWAPVPAHVAGRRGALQVRGRRASAPACPRPNKSEGRGPRRRWG